MKIIYTETTLSLLSQIEGIESVNNLVKTGVIKETVKIICTIKIKLLPLQKNKYYENTKN